MKFVIDKTRVRIFLILILLICLINNQDDLELTDNFYSKCSNSFFIYIDLLIFQQMLSGNSEEESRTSKINNHLHRNSLHDIKFNFGESKIPHIEKRVKGGEDASYLSENLIVVADGVGGWNDEGVDPSLWSKALCRIIGEKYEQYNSNPYTKYHFSESILKMFLIESCKENKHIGSSTCCLMLLDKLNKSLYTCNIGDSGYLILRRRSSGLYSQLFKSEEQLHGFNFPFQVGSTGDNPTSSVTKSHKIEVGDLVILASDGLWDNLENEDILQIVNDTYKRSQSHCITPNQLARTIAEKAEKMSMRRDYFSPFAKRAFQSGRRFIGGKQDDITIVIGEIGKK